MPRTSTNRKLKDLGNALITEIEAFFVNYARLRGKQFKPLARRGPKAAMELVRDGMRRHGKKRKKKTTPRAGAK